MSAVATVFSGLVLALSIIWATSFQASASQPELLEGKILEETLETELLEPYQDETYDERIRLFDSTIVINQDGSVTVTEKIEYLPPYEKHGIYRYIPLRYPDPPFVKSTPLKDVSVTLGDGQPHPFQLYTEEGNTTLKIGDPDATFNEPRTYVITYTADRAVTKTNQVARLIWDITGEGWDFPISQTRATVISEVGEFSTIDCYTGSFGHDDELCEYSLGPSNTSAGFTYDHTIFYGDNMTVDLYLGPDNIIQVPGTLQQQTTWFRDNWPVFVLFLPILIMGGAWYRWGRDYVYYTEPIIPDERKPSHLQPPFTKQRVPFVYEPFTDITPGQAGAILDEKVDNQDVIAEILDLARKKYIKIMGIYKNEQQKQKGKLKDYSFVKMKEADNSLPDYQKYLMDQIFKGGKKERLVSKMKGSFSTAFSQTKSKIVKSTKTLGWFTRNATADQAGGFMLGLFLVIGSLALSIFYASISQTWWWIGLPILQAAPALLAGWNMPQKTAKGSAMMSRVRGLKKTIEYGKWREEIKEKRLFIDEVLPFAIATGVIDQLTKDMKDLSIPEPEYVSGFTTNSAAWANTLNSFSSAASSSLSYNPSSSSSSGGGFSGGGGGGGGGGSW